MHIGILIKPSLNPVPLQELLQKLDHSFEILQKEVTSSVHRSPFTLILAYGGDGTVLLGMQHALANKCPLYGLEGGSFGFLHSGTMETLDEDLKAFEAGEAKLQKRLLLEATIGAKNYYALNDIVLSSQNPVQIIHSEILINDELFTHYKADGIIVATPTGSTAYSLSAGGSILHPNLRGMILTPIASHSLAQRSIVLGAEDVVTLKSEDDTHITIDGQFQIPTHSCTVKIAKEYVECVMPKDRGFFELLREKFGWK